MAQKKCRVLLDGDILLYRNCHVVEKLFTWSEDLHTLVSDSREARERMQADVADIVAKVAAAGVNVGRQTLVFSGPNNWRKVLYPEYKANRLASRKPIAFGPVKQWFLENTDSALWDNLEADDAMGILSTNPKNLAIIVSADKDMKTIPGLLMNPDKDVFPVEISVADANYHHMVQTLTGDATDHYPGCPGVGPVGAEKILNAVPREDPGAMWAAVVAAYAKAGLDEAAATVQAKLARILRHGDWDFKKGRMLWSPPRIS